jgi:hypothetical protein
MARVARICGMNGPLKSEYIIGKLRWKIASYDLDAREEIKGGCLRLPFALAFLIDMIFHFHFQLSENWTLCVIDTRNQFIIVLA